MQVTRKIGLDYGHRLPNHYGFCSQLHGHRATVEATASGELSTDEGSSDQGMVFDFSHLKEALMDNVHDELDHGFAVWVEDTEIREWVNKVNDRVLIMDHPPTAEVLAKWAYEQVEPELPEHVMLVSIRWYETPNNWAEYSGLIS